MVSVGIIKLLVPTIADENKSLVHWLTLTTKISDESMQMRQLLCA